VNLTQRLNLYEKLMRLDRPIGIFLLLWPTLWGLWFAAKGHPDWVVMWIFILGTVLMRSAGCVFNDVADMEFDARVQRTRDRPLAAGLMSKKEALILAAVLVLGAFLLVVQLNRLTILLSGVALLLALSYPYSKRYMAVPQAHLGVAFGFGIPMAFASHTWHAPAVTWVLLLANVFWSMAYDTEYAMVDREDDLKIGIRTSAITFGRHDVATVMACYFIMLTLLATVGLWQQMGVLYYAGLLAAAALAGYHYTLIRDREPQKCFKAFRHNTWVGLAIFLGVAADFYHRYGV
jgi:4-hydroxybenzoate polyprenyltransferase